MHRADNRSNKDEKADNQKYSIKAAEVRRTTSLKSHSIRFYSVVFASKLVTFKKKAHRMLFEIFFTGLLCILRC